MVKFGSKVELAVLNDLMLLDEAITDEASSAIVDAVLVEPYGLSVFVSLKRTNFGVL